jgi:hypothetical protein
MWPCGYEEEAQAVKLQIMGRNRHGFSKLAATEPPVPHDFLAPDMQMPVLMRPV